MKASKITVCRADNLGITGVQLELSTFEPVEPVNYWLTLDEDEEPPEEIKTLVLEPIGDVSTECTILELEEGYDHLGFLAGYGSN